MGKKAFEKVMTGVKDIKAFDAGDKTAAKITRGKTLKKVKSAKIRPPDVKELRLKLGYSQETFSAVYGIPLSTLRKWEQSGAPKTGAGAAYLTAIAKNPERVAKDLAA